MVSINDLQEVLLLHELFKEPITGPLKFNMADGHHFTNRLLAVTQQLIQSINQSINQSIRKGLE